MGRSLVGRMRTARRSDDIGDHPPRHRPATPAGTVSWCLTSHTQSAGGDDDLPVLARVVFARQT